MSEAVPFIPETVPVPVDQTRPLTDAEIVEEAARLREAQQFDEAIQLLQPLIDRDNPYPDALNEMGILYDDGSGVERDDEMALSFYQRAHDLGERDATYNLAQMYLNGEGTDKNIQKAIDLFTSCVDRGDTDAALKLGDIYNSFSSNHDLINFDKALEWYLIAARGGNSEAQTYLATTLSDRYQELLGSAYWISETIENENTPESEQDDAEDVLRQNLHDIANGNSELVRSVARAFRFAAKHGGLPLDPKFAPQPAAQFGSGAEPTGTVPTALDQTL